MAAKRGTPAGAGRPAAERPALRDETIRRIEQAIGGLATMSVARMDEELAWFRELPADQRSWVTLVAQAGLQSYVGWMRTRDNVLRLTGEVFAAAPKAMARSVSLQQTVELVHQVIEVAEENLPAIACPEDVATVREELLRFSREIAFAAARVYATAAETRGSWDQRLEALVIDGLVRGADVGEPLPSQIAALGWQAVGRLVAVVGRPSTADAAAALDAVHELTRSLGMDAIAGVHGERLVVVVALPDRPGDADNPADAAGDAAGDPARTAAILLPAFGGGPVVHGPAADDLRTASDVTRTALAGLAAVPAWPAAPRPVAADDLLPERALAGDDTARAALVETVYAPLVGAGDVLLDTVSTFLDYGGALEASARALFVHANTVRYRLRRVAEVCGQSPTDPRGAFALRLALTWGRLDTARDPARALT